MLKTKIPLWVLIVCVIILSLPYGIKLINRVKFEVALNNIYKNCNQYYTGMRLLDFYEITGSEVHPTIKIEFDNRDSSYHHYIYYPPPYGKELYFKFEFDPKEHILIEKYLPASCPNF